MNELFKYIDETTEKAKGKRAEQLARFHLGDVVYPLYQLWRPTLWGTVVEINPDIHKIHVNINGVVRQYDPEELILTNPELKPDSKYNEERDKMIEKAAKKVKASFSGRKKFQRRFKAEIMFYKDLEDDQIEIPYVLTVMAPDIETARDILNGLCEEKMEDEGCFDSSIKSITEESNDKMVTASLNDSLRHAYTVSNAYSFILRSLENAGKIKGFFSDQDWSGIYGIIDYLKSMGVDATRDSINSENYRTDGGTKEWHYTLSFMNDKDERIELYVYLIAAAAGTVEDPWLEYDITMPLKGGKIISRQKAEKANNGEKVMPAYREWKHDVRQCCQDSNKGIEVQKQYDDFMADCLNYIGLAENAGKTLDMDMFRENVINAIFAFRTAYELGKNQLTAESANKLEKAKGSCDSLALALRIDI